MTKHKVIIKCKECKHESNIIYLYRTNDIAHGKITCLMRTDLPATYHIKSDKTILADSTCRCSNCHRKLNNIKIGRTVQGLSTKRYIIREWE